MYLEEVAYKDKHPVKSILVFPPTPWVLQAQFLVHLNVC